MGVEVAIPAVLFDTVSSVKSFVDVFIYVYVLVIFAFILTSWIRLPYSTWLNRVQRFLYDVCDPYLRLFRRVVPSLGPLDLSPVLAVLVLFALQKALDALLGGDLDVARSEEEDLVGDALHSAVHRVGQAAAEVDEPLRELLVGALQVEDDRHPLLEAVGDLLCVVEASRQHEVDADRAGTRDALDPAQPARLGGRPEDARPRVRRRLRIRPVVELLAAAAPVREAAHVRALGVRTLELLVGDVPVLVPVLLLGDAEVDEGAVPDVCEGHG